MFPQHRWRDGLSLIRVINSEPTGFFCWFFVFVLVMVLLPDSTFKKLSSQSDRSKQKAPQRHKNGGKNSSCKQGNLTGLSVLVVSRPNQEIKAHLVVQTKKIILIELKASTDPPPGGCCGSEPDGCVDHRQGTVTPPGHRYIHLRRSEEKHLQMF